MQKIKMLLSLLTEYRFGNEWLTNQHCRCFFVCLFFQRRHYHNSFLWAIGYLEILEDVDKCLRLDLNQTWLNLFNCGVTLTRRRTSGQRNPTIMSVKLCMEFGSCSLAWFVHTNRSPSSFCFSTVIGMFYKLPKKHYVPSWTFFKHDSLFSTVVESCVKEASC